MATAAEQTSIIELIVGMVGAAPGADILAELVDIVDAGVTMEELAVALQENPAYSGDMGLFPNYLPNAIYATQFVTNLLGDEVTEEVLEEAIDAFTAQLNAGESRGAVSYATVTALSASTDPDYADATLALANKTAVAEYYSVTLAVSSMDLDDLIAVVSGVDSAADAVADGEDAVDSAIAAGQGLTGLLSQLEAANAAKKAFLVTADGDDKATTSTDDTAIGAAVTTATAAVEAFDGDMTGYAAASTVLKAALIADEVAQRAKVVSDAQKALAAAKSNTTASPGGTDQVAGLEAAIIAANDAVDASDDADDALIVAAATLVGAETAYTNLNAGTATATGGGTYSDGTDPIITYNATTKTFSLATGVTETTDPGVTALLSASVGNVLAGLAVAAADKAEILTQRIVENLDQDAAGAAALLAATNKMTVVNPGKAGKATVAELDAEAAGLKAIVTALDAVALANTDTATDHAGAIGAINTALGGLTADPADSVIIAEHNGITADAVADGYLTAADKTAIDTAFAALQVGNTGAVVGAAVTASQGALATENASGRDDAWNTAVTGTLAVYEAADNVTTRADAYNLAAGNIVTGSLAVAAFDKVIATEAAALAVAADLKAVNKVITDANAAFGPAGFEVPEPVDAAVESATGDEDVFLATGSPAASQILSFGSDDTLFIGEDVVLNADTKAGDNGDNDVLEVWITGTSSAVITVETSVFGSEAATPETYTITLTGVAAADVSYADGFITAV